MDGWMDTEVKSNHSHTSTLPPCYSSAPLSVHQGHTVMVGKSTQHQGEMHTHTNPCPADNTALMGIGKQFSTSFLFIQDNNVDQIKFPLNKLIT